MQASPNITSAWQRLKKNELSCEEAIALLVDPNGVVNQTLLDKEVSSRFLRHFPDKSCLPPAIPLLLWRGCYYIGSPVPLSADALAQLQQRTGSQIEIIHIADKSYRTWFHSQSLNPNQISSMPLVNPITGQLEQEDISETTEIYLSKAVDQIERIKTIISGALRNRASDIHLEPMTDGLRVRYRIDGVLRDITTLPIGMSRRVVMALKVMCNMDIAEHRRPQDGRIEEKYALNDIARFLDRFLAIERYSDSERGGVYIPSTRPIERIGLALEPWENLPKWVEKQKLDALFLHRPWQLQSEFIPDIGVLSYHLAFDERMTLGFNPRLADVLSMSDLEVLGEKQGRAIGAIGNIPQQNLSEYLHCITEIFGGQEEVYIRTTEVSRMAVVGGMTDALVREAATRGANLYVTGQMRQPAVEALEATGISAIAVGHRRCELWGLRSLAGLLRDRWSGLSVISYQLSVTSDQ